MKLTLWSSVVVCVWSVGMMVHGYSNYHKSPYSGNCGVQLTKTRTGGVYHAYPSSTTAASGYGYESDTANTAAASSLQSSVASSSNNNNNNDYYGSYGSGSGRYPYSSSAQYGSGYNNGYQSASASSNSYGSSSNSNYGSASSYNGYGSSASSSSGGYAGNSASSSNYGSGTGWSQTATGNGASSAYDDARFAEDILYAHNSYRARHSTPPVTLDERMNQKAQEWAEEMASGREDYGHSPSAIEGIYGESLQVLNTAYPSGADVMEHWYNEMGNYNYKSPTIVKRPISQRNSHFTALLWYATRKIGVGKATSPVNGKSFVVVMYYPPGNNVGVLEDNVFPPKNP